MRSSIYDSVAFQGGVSLPPQSFSGSSAVNGNTVNTVGMTDAAIRAYAAAPSGAPTAASLVVTLQESATGNSGWANALDNTGTVIGFTLSPLLSITGNTTNGSNQVVSVNTTTGLYVGQYVTGTGIPANTVITAVTVGTSTSTITLSANATATNTGTALTLSAESAARIEGLNLNRKQYLRAVITPSFTGGTSPAILGFAEIVQGGPPQQLPATSATSNT